MESENNVVEQTAPVVNPLDELNANVEEFRGKLKLLLDESGVLIRKVKEVGADFRTQEKSHRSLTAVRL